MLSKLLPENASLPGRVASALLWCAAVVLAVLLFATFLAQASPAGPTVDRVGTASVRSCVAHGPVSAYGFGNLHTCSAEVDWSDGEVTTERFPAGELRPADAGHQVPVYLDYQASDEGGTVLGRNVTAKFSAWYLPGIFGFGLLILGLVLGALVAVVNVFRTKDAGDTRRAGRASRSRRERKWEVTRADRIATPVSRITTRIRLLAMWCAVACLYGLLATLARYDAPRSQAFESPWPGIARGLLVDPALDILVVIVLMVVALLYSMARLSHTQATRIHKYGPEFLAQGLRGEESAEQRVANEMATLHGRRRRHLQITWVIGGLIAFGAVWAAARVILSVSVTAPPLVWAAAFRDAALLAALAAIWLGTTETKYGRLQRLLTAHRTSRSGIPGTEGEASAS